MESRSLPLLALLALLALALLASSAQAQVCPMTGLPPSTTTAAWSRCRDAREKTCCTDCTDLSIGLSLVSANISSMLNSVSPVLLPILKGQDITFCTVVYPSASCQDNLEQLACAMQCNPDSGSYIASTWATRTLNLCQNFTDALIQSCYYAQVSGNTPITNQTFLGDSINPKYFLQALGNIVTAAVGLPHFEVVTSNSTTGCYGGPIVAPDTHVCCDNLTVPATCPSTAVDFTRHPNWARFSGIPVDNNTCRAENPFPVGPVDPLPSPPPPPPMPAGAMPPFSAPAPLSFNASNTTQANSNANNYPPPSGKKGSQSRLILDAGVTVLLAALCFLV